MAISTTWVDFLNGGTGAAIRAALNTFNKNILADVIATEGRVGIAEPKITTNISDISDLDKYTQAQVDALIATATDNNYVHTETPASASWVINHALGKQYPAVQAYDGSGNRVHGDITFTNANNLFFSI